MYLELNKTLDPEERERYTFATIAKAFRWSGGKWIRRTDKFPFRGVIRIGHVSPANKKLHVSIFFLNYFHFFFHQALRALAYHVYGPTSWDDYKTYDVPYDTYWEAAVARGLCDDDQYIWRQSANAAMLTLKTLRERVYWMAVFLIKNQPNNPLQIVDENLQYLTPRAITHSDPDVLLEMRRRYFLLRLEYIMWFALFYTFNSIHSLSNQVIHSNLADEVLSLYRTTQILFRNKHVVKELDCPGSKCLIYRRKILLMCFFAFFLE